MFRIDFDIKETTSGCGAPGVGDEPPLEQPRDDLSPGTPKIEDAEYRSHSLVDNPGPSLYIPHLIKSLK